MGLEKKGQELRRQSDLQPPVVALTKMDFQVFLLPLYCHLKFEVSVCPWTMQIFNVNFTANKGLTELPCQLEGMETFYHTSNYNMCSTFKTR